MSIEKKKYYRHFILFYFISTQVKLQQTIGCCFQSDVIIHMYIIQIRTRMHTHAHNHNLQGEFFLFRLCYSSLM